jgi:hypothetical protein
MLPTSTTILCPDCGAVLAYQLLLVGRPAVARIRPQELELLPLCTGRLKHLKPSEIYFNWALVSIKHHVHALH